MNVSTKVSAGRAGRPLRTGRDHRQTRQVRSGSEAGMQHARRGDPVPFTWEIPAAVTAGAVLVLVLGIHLGRAGANLLAGAGWGWPARAELLRSLPDLLRGDPFAGLHGGDLDGVTGAARAGLWAGIGFTELVLLGLLVWALKVGLDRWGPRRVQGMATRAEAERMLGRARLRKAAAVVRPDLYDRDRQRGADRNRPTGRDRG